MLSENPVFVMIVIWCNCKWSHDLKSWIICFTKIGAYFNSFSQTIEKPTVLWGHSVYMKKCTQPPMWVFSIRLLASHYVYWHCNSYRCLMHYSDFGRSYRLHTLHHHWRFKTSERLGWELTKILLIGFKSKAWVQTSHTRSSHVSKKSSWQ